MKEVYINDILLDLSEKDNPIALSYQVNDLGELKDRQAFTSNNFKVPITQNNRKACGYPDDGAIISVEPYRKNRARIVQDGIEIISNGIAIITGTSNSIEIQVLSGIIDFFSLLDGKSIRDLDFSDLEHVWNRVTVRASQANTSGYVYPIIDYGNLPLTGKTIDARYLRPAVFRHTIIEKIISGTGYEIEGLILKDPIYLRGLLPFSLDKFEHGKSFNINSFRASAKTNQFITYNNNTRDHVISFPDDATTDPSGLWNGTEYTSAVTAKVKVSLKYTIDVRDTFKGGSQPQVSIYVQKLISGVWNAIAENEHYPQGEFQTQTLVDQKLDLELDMKPGDKIRVLLRYEPSTDRMLAAIYSGATINIDPVQQDVIFGQSVQLEATLPDISQKDFFKEFLQNFGLIVLPISGNKIKLTSLSEVYSNIPNAKDWTEKFTDDTIQYDYDFGDYGINNYGKYKQDENVPIGLGDGLMIFDNQTLKQEVDIFTSKFSATESVFRLDGVQVSRINKISNPVESLDFSVKTQPRILLDNKASIGFATIGDPTGSNGNNLPLSIPLFSGISYQDLFNKYYYELQRMLYRPLVIERNILLNAIDIYELDFTKPIFDKKTGSYYYLNSIKNYIAGEVCNCILVKMP